MKITNKVKLEKALSDYKQLLIALDGIIKENPKRDSRLWDALVVLKNISEPKEYIPNEKEYSDSCRYRL